ncbi:MAG: hypothetical protein R3E08_02840 [Thiotrichaceae bacterium]
MTFSRTSMAQVTHWLQGKEIMQQPNLVSYVNKSLGTFTGVPFKVLRAVITVLALLLIFNYLSNCTNIGHGTVNRINPANIPNQF